MRWMVVALLLANVLMFGWYRYVGSPVDEKAAVVDFRPKGAALELVGANADTGSEPARNRQVGGEAKTMAVAADPSLCGMIGAFREQISARQVRDRLLALGVSAEIAEIPVTVRTDYWVHMGPYPSRERAMAVLRELQQKGVDSFLIGDGELANGISLGLFRQKASAEALLATRKAQGHQASLREIPRSVPELWVVIKEGGGLAESVRNQLLSVAPGIEYRKNPCDAIVTAK